MRNIPGFTLLWLLAATTAFSGSIPGLFNTGVDGTGALLANNEVDAHYTIAASADPDFPGPDAFTLLPGFPVGPWLAEGPLSRWIAPQADQSTGNQPGGYTFTTTFNLTGLDVASAQISGQITADNSVTAVRLNGTDLGRTSGGFNVWTPFSIPVGSPFIDGTNTLEFDVSNGGVDPIGFRAELTSRVNGPNDAPSLAVQPQPQTVIVGDIVAFNVEANGASPLNFQWNFNGKPIPGATETSYIITGVKTNDAGQYSVTISNLIGQATSTNATLTVLTPFPGIYNTGLNDSRALLDDGEQDPHYRLTLNDNDSSSAIALVQDSTVFPIVDGTWVRNSSKSKWIGPLFETSAAAAGNYTYQLALNLTGYDPASAFIAGSWTADDGGSLFLNGADTGFKSAGFGSFSTFNLTNGFVSGTNLLEFRISNSAIGYTGLRVENLRGTAQTQAAPPPAFPRVVAQPQSSTNAMTGQVTFAVVADGSAPLQYQWLHNGIEVTNATNLSLTITSILPVDAGGYTARISNSLGSTNSNTAQLTVIQPELGIFNTGVDSTGALLPLGQADPHYLLMTHPDPAFPTLTPFVPAGAPIPPWVANGPDSRWIGVRPDAVDAAPGTYQYRLLFNISADDLATTAITASVATDDGNLGIRFNGEDAGFGASGFGGYTDLTIPEGSPFVAGLNILDFFVSNGGISANPTGLRVDQMVLTGVTEIPAIAIARADSNIRISWPASAVGFTLQETSALPGGWTNSIISIAVQGNENVGLTPIGQGAKFYRLTR